jgi:hypothetical protein
MSNVCAYNYQCLYCIFNRIRSAFLMLELLHFLSGVRLFISRTFSASQQCFSLIINLLTVISVETSESVFLS